MREKLTATYHSFDFPLHGKLQSQKTTGLMNVAIMIEYINEIILPHINEKQRDLQLSNEQPAF